MTPFVQGFADELIKIAEHHGESLSDIAGAEALGPIASAVKGYKRHGIGGAAKAGLAYAAGGGAGALAGGAIAKGLQHVTGHDLGVGPVRASTVLPAIGALMLGLRAERWANR